ncbi:PQQ-dependent sugar dehydrogenase [Actinocrispum wychmicini]|uniref:Glucose/arabinose dehydrogenase n=1 Tax=Actinocrispum wychmicini TaxID=1213861 RepID=A0A4R2J754_9PSEU|nr:PQQ-dependent sugar dehydrogenase [Actinocrispum wychmicini]TCO53432.1 glucose/arabinose dehydrogenase [Actinocrispum wychmicini]
MAPSSRWRRTLSWVTAGVTALAIMPAAMPAAAAPTKYEAEDATIDQGVVANNHTGFSGTGFVDYTNVAGSSVEFTVTAAQAGAATLTFHFANGTTVNRPVDIAVNGTTIASAVAFNGTGSWDTWQDVTVNATLTAGANKVKATATTANGGPNLDYLQADVAAPAGNDFEAEDATIVQGVVAANHTGFSGRGFVDYTNVAGSYVEWTVNGPGAADLVIRYANGTTVNRPMDIAVNGTTVAANMAFNSTGTWDQWQTATVHATLTSGPNKIRATATTANGGPNVDKLSVSNTDSESPSPPQNLRSTGHTSSSTSLAWDAATDNVGIAGYEIYQHGQHMKSVGNVLAATVDGLDPDTDYEWAVVARDAANNVSQASNVVVVHTDPAPPDTQAPTTPGTLSSPGKSATTVDLAWGASTDNVKVTSYDVFTNGAQSGSADGSATTTTVAGLTTGQEYKFKVRARDKAGNVSGFSNEIAVTPTAGGPAGVPNPGTVTTLASGVDVAWGLVFLPDGSALFSERNNFNISRLTKSGQKTLAGKISQAVGTNGEGGLLGLEIAPTFTGDHWLYVYHTASEGNRVIRIKYENGALVQNTYQILVQGIQKNQFHNGGRLRFGPDGKLYVSVGDAENPDNNPQNKNSLNGKILRINPDGTIPADNPFGNAVWSMGHRNPQGLDFDSKGRLWESEFGDSTQDEVNLIQKGGNYGWNKCEGTTGNCAGFIPPKMTWSTKQASPSGLTIINDYVFVATTVGQRVYRMRIDANSNLVDTQQYFQGTFNRLRTVEVDHDGDIWMTTTTDKDGTPNNDKILLVHIDYSGGGAFALTSSAFQNNGTIPAKYTCAGDGKAGQDTSPPLSWAAGTTNAKAYAIVLADTANSGNKLHWAIWDVPGTTLAEGLGAGFTVPNVPGAKQKAMGSGNDALKFFGPCPGGTTHPYTFTLYAQNTTTVPGLTANSTMAQIETAIKNASTANAKLAGNSNAGT